MIVLILSLMLALSLIVTLYLWDRIVFYVDVAESQLGEIKWYQNAIRRAASVDRLRDDLESHLKHAGLRSPARGRTGRSVP